MTTKPKVLVALSGGVDSSVAAFLLQKAGYEVTGCFMKFWQDSRLGRENPCCSPEAERRARILARRLQIPFFVLDLKKEFKKAVVDYFLSRTRLGLTPNPCVVCNEEIKFGLFLKKALERGADFMATGHYAKIKEGRLFKAKDKEKDQSYFLWRLNQTQLSRVIFPIGDYSKNEVRKIAQKAGLSTAKTPDSQNLCFLASGTSQFLKFNLRQKPGNIIARSDISGILPAIDTAGEIIGRHQGLGLYTIGQRGGIGPCLFPKFQSQGPYYVLRKNRLKNLLVVTRNEKDLFIQEFKVSDLVLNLVKHKWPLRVMVKIRSRQKEMPATLSPVLNLVKHNQPEKIDQFLVRLDRPERAVTPGQSAVFYQGQELLGGGIISAA
ncbi:MAG: tRNA 2-thiouridine(34) synthase MnmA [Candidatus Wildermuthbacteria bacterium GWA2_46_15]|uniref:tRNA-specific 2-thiouridylase MnmA n=1 Tax=Candidatus Wildermuthbacteria bacterium GWA2_46_15 TaxID=1802443 RepID=A0A1G2QN78_9BACT|nr:MAG: tRNA 2-thiouridine(34) synthase MnmA [Candidatus Wildermuthbacteria bacterium GWA2_46_15]